jgi:hypothetical protein
MNSPHANHVFLIGQVIQTWTYSDDRICRVAMQRTSFQVPGQVSDLVNIVIPGAVKRGIVIKKGDTLHVNGFIRNEDRETTLSKLTKIKLPDEFKDLKIKQIVTQVYASNWQLVS